jgi:putative MATE family efflux protein
MNGEMLRHRELMVSGSIDRAILHLGAPAALAALLQAGFLVVDTFWLGRVGAAALAAVSTAGFVMWIAQTIADGLAMGAGSVLAQAVGAGSQGQARRAAAAGLLLAVWGSVVVSGVGLALCRWVFELMGTDPEVTELGVGYMRTILLTIPAYFLFSWIAAAFRAVGDARTPLLLLGVAALVNVVADPLLIFGVGPLPRLEATGAALATALSWLVACTTGWIMLRRIDLRPGRLKLLRPNSEAWQALRIGLPLAAEGTLFSVIYILLTRVTTTFGTPAVAALGVGHKLEVLNYFVCAGMAAATTTLVGQNLGAGEPERASRCAWRALFLTLLPVGAVTAALVAFPKISVAVFIDEPEVVAVGATYVLLVGMSQLFMAAEVIGLGAYAGMQWTAVPAAIEISLTAARVPLAVWLVSLGWGVEGVWLAIAGTTVVKGIILATIFAWRYGNGAGE